MNAHHKQGGASALPTLPPIKRGRVRRASYWFSGGGEISLNALLVRGEEAPSNVVRFKPLPEPVPIERSPELLLLAHLFAELPKERREAIWKQVAVKAYDLRCPHAAGLLEVMQPPAVRREAQ